MTAKKAFLNMFNPAVKLNILRRGQINYERDLRTMYDSIQRPAYTCPKCRDPVERAPIDCYLLKCVTQAVAKASGDGDVEPTNTAKSQEGVWDGFFPPIPKFSEL